MIPFTLTRIIIGKEIAPRWRKEGEHGEYEQGEKERSSRRRQSVISSVIDHHATHCDSPSGRGLRPYCDQRLVQAECEKISRNGVQCLSGGMIYCNDALFSAAPIFPPIRVVRKNASTRRRSSNWQQPSGTSQDVPPHGRHMDECPVLVIKIRFSNQAVSVLFCEMRQTISLSC